ncbi:hypothetical protein N7512_001817 [Penicillium capsulatum]|nr:hypothetical protein N7512_001817 [Penicillium capsulatum]
MKSQTIEELMIFLYTLRFDIEEQEVRLLKKFFSYDEIEAAKEEKNEKLDEVEIDLIRARTQAGLPSRNPDPTLGRSLRPKTQPSPGWVRVGSGLYWVVRKSTHEAEYPILASLA